MVFLEIYSTYASQHLIHCFPPFLPAAREENVATFRGSEYLCYDLSQNPIQSSSDEITLSFKTWQRNGLILHTGKSADYVNLALKDGAVSLVINLGSGAFEAIVEPVNGKFNDNAWHDVKVTRNLRQVMLRGESAWRLLLGSQGGIVKQVMGEVERGIEMGLHISKSNFLPVFATSQGKLLKCASSHTSILHLCLLFKKKFNCVDNKSYKYFHFF